MSSSSAASRSGSGRVSSSRAISSCLRSSVAARRSMSIARCLAVAISQAPGFFGTPDCGHRSRATTSASCARSSARPTSRTMRARPAISRGDSILQTASIARCVGDAVTEGQEAVVWCGGVCDSSPAAACTSSGKSDISKTWRTSIAAPSSIGHREAHSTASSLERA
jgi:hypothetical protein